MTDRARERGESISIATVCEVAAEVLSADGAAVSVIANGDVHLSLCATSDLARRLEDLQSTLGEGPGLQSFAECAPVLLSELGGGDERWPLFGPGAVAMGVRSLFAFPLQSEMVPLGAFQVYRATPMTLTGEQIGDALLLADIISLLVLGSEGREERDFFNDALCSERHVEVYQATGMVSVQLGVSLADALASIRGHAFACGRSISSIAHEVVHEGLRFEKETND